MLTRCLSEEAFSVRTQWLYSFIYALAKNMIQALFSLIHTSDWGIFLHESVV